MDIEKAEQLLRLYEEGYDIYWESYYLDTSLTIWKNEFGLIKFRSEVWAEQELTGVSTTAIKVSKPVNEWEDL